MTLQDQITAAEAALARLMTGEAVVKVQDGESQIQYQPADAGKLRAYIADLRSQLGGAGGRTSSRRVFF